MIINLAASILVLKMFTTFLDASKLVVYSWWAKMFGFVKYDISYPENEQHNVWYTLFCVHVDIIIGYY